MADNTPSQMHVTIPPLKGVVAQPWSLRKVAQMMGMFGPAAIVASCAIGAGETIVVVRAGSWSGYDLMWLVLVSVLVKGVFVTYMIGRYTAVSGEHIGHRLVRLPGPRGWFLITIIILEMLAAPLVWAVISKPCGNLLFFLFKDLLPADGNPVIWERGIATGFVTIALLTSLGITFKRLELQQLIICAVLVIGTVIGTLMVRPDFLAALKGTLQIGHVPSEFPDWTPKATRENAPLMLVTMFGYVGGTVMSYIVYANWIGLRRWGITSHENIEAIREHAATSDRIDYLPDDPKQVKRLRKLMSPLRWDVTMGAVVLWVVTAAFMMAGAAVLYPMLRDGQIEGGFKNWDLLTSQAFIWKNIHPYLVWVYYVCVLAALWGTLQALPEIYSRVTHEFCQAISSTRTWGFKTIQRVICVYMLIVTTWLVWSDIDFTTLTAIVAFLAANLAIVMMMVGALYLNYKLPCAYRTRWPMVIGAVASAIILAVVTAVSAWGLAMKLFG